MAISLDDPFISSQAFNAHRSPRVQFVRANADFRAQPILAAVGESRAGVDHDAGRVDALYEAVAVREP